MVMAPAALRAQAAETVVVFAAASLTDAFEEIGTAFEADHADVRVVFSFAGSSTLATQLVEGAPSDVFASANFKQMQVVIDAGRMAEPVVIFARNRLVVIVPAENPGRIETLDDLARPGLRLVLAAEGVPVRDYTEAMLDQMAATDEYGPAYRTAVLVNVVSEEDNVRQVAAKVALGEADAGIVYLSDMTPNLSDQVMSIAVPDEFNTVAAYPIGVITDSAAPRLAQAFVDFVLSDEGQAILGRWNFLGKCPDANRAEATPEATTSPEATDRAGCP
ncbi:MAG: molybdate ABC transporter substrate-binding protein [Anaerolineae bacterium]|nr:molybdate ABC transporter substrate-binding protein [Anaerolineae bacterium]